MPGSKMHWVRGQILRNLSTTRGKGDFLDSGLGRRGRRVCGVGHPGGKLLMLLGGR